MPVNRQNKCYSQHICEDFKALRGSILAVTCSIYEPRKKILQGNPGPLNSPNIERHTKLIEHQCLQRLLLLCQYVINVLSGLQFFFCLCTSRMFRRQAQSLFALLVFACLLSLIADAAKSCPPGCNCVSNSFDRPDIETTVVDCSYKGFADFPVSLPNSTTELYIQVDLLWDISFLSSAGEVSSTS